MKAKPDVKLCMYERWNSRKLGIAAKLEDFAAVYLVPETFHSSLNSASLLCAPASR